MKTVSRHLEISVNKPKTMPTCTIHSSAKRQTEDNRHCKQII